MDKEMELLLAEKELKLGNKKVVVKRLSLLDTIRLTSKISDLVSSALNESNAVGSAIGKITYTGSEGSDDNAEISINSIRALGVLELIGILGEDGTELLKEFIIKSTNISDEDAENIDCLEGIELIENIYEVNKSFFVKCMSKLEKKIVKKEKPTKK